MKKTPFFARFLEGDSPIDESQARSLAGGLPIVTKKFPSDDDEIFTKKYPSDLDE